MGNDMEKKVEAYFKNRRRVKNVEPCDGYMLLLTFDNWEKVYDMSNRLIGVFAPLQDREKSDSVFVDKFGNVSWDIVDPENC